MIKLTISKKVENPDYREPSVYQQFPCANKFIDETILTVELTEEEYKAIKKAILEVK